MRHFGILWAVLAALFIAGCGGDSIKSPTFTQILQAVTIQPSTASTPIGRTVQFTAVGEYTLPPGSATPTEQRPIEDGVQWAVGNTSIATIDQNGVATGVSPGSTQVTATIDGVSSTPATLNVGDAVVESIAITPANPTVSLGNTVVLSAIGTFSDGETGPVSVNWSSSNTGVATLAPATGPSTTATGVSQGGSTITASTVNADGDPVSATTTLTVGPFEPILLSLQVTPDPATQPVGRPVQFSATGTFSTAPGGGGTTTMPATVTWSSANNAVAVIDAQSGIATGQMVGTTLVTATAANGVSDSATFNVTEAVLDRVVIAPANPSVAVGGVIPLTANAVFTDGRLEPASADWTLQPSGGIGEVAFDPTPAVTTQMRGVTEGSAVIRATLAANPEFFGETNVTVTDAELLSLSRIVPATAQVNPGRSVEFTLLGNFSGGIEQAIDDSLVTWTSSNPEFATITGDGVATGVAEGTTTITAAATGISGTRMATLFVTDSQCTTPLLASDGAVVTEVTTGLCVGCTILNEERIIDGSEATAGTLLLPVGVSNQATLSAVVTAANNANYTLPFAAGNNAGFVIGRPAGLLSAEVLERIQVSTLLGGVVQQTSGDTDLLRVDLLGQQLLGGDVSDVALVSLQTNTPYDAVSISVVSGAAAVLTDVRVFQACGTVMPPVQPTLVGLSRIEPISPTIVRGQARNLVAFGTITGGGDGPAEAEIADADLDWTSSNPSVATVNDLGVVTAIETGSATITATLKDSIASSGGTRSAVSNVTVVAGACTVPFSDLEATVSRQVNGLCGLLGPVTCSAANLPAAADGSLVTAATVNLTLGLLDGSVDVTVLNPAGASSIAGGDFTGFVLGRPLNPLLQLELLDSIEVSTLRRTLTGPVEVENSTAAAQTTPLRLGLLGLELVGENELVLAGFRTTQPYDGIRVRFNAGVASALSNYLVFESCAVAEPTLLP